MKKEIEIKWIINLLSESELKNNLFFKKGSSICGFEKYAQAPLNSKEFRIWFEFLLNNGIVEYFGVQESERSRAVQTYLLNKGKLTKYLKDFDLYKKVSKIVINNL